MMNEGSKIKDRIKIEKVLTAMQKLFLFALPWQTIWIYREVFVNGVKLEYATLGFYATEILLWTIILLFIVWYWKKWNIEHRTWNIRFRLTKDRIFIIACLLFIIYHLSSIIWSSDKALALQQAVRVIEAFLLLFMLVLGPLKFGEAVKWLVLGAILSSALGIWQFFSQSAFAFKWLGLAEHIASNPGTSVVVGDEVGRWLRAYGTFSHPNVFGGYLVLVLILVLLWVSVRKPVTRSWQLFCISYLLSLIPVFLSFSRSAWIAISVAVAGVVFLLYRAGERLRAFYLFSLSMLLFVIFVSLFSFMVKERLPADFQFNFSSSSEIRSIEERQAGYGEAWQIFKTHPWLGVGAGNYTLALYQLNSNRPGWEYQPAHNVGLLFLAESGVVGAFFLVLVIISFIIYYLSLVGYHGTRIMEHVTDNPTPDPDNLTQLESAKTPMSHVIGVGSQEIYFLLFAFCYLTLAFFDHYLISSYVGLILAGVFWGLMFRYSRDFVPSSSTDYPHSA